MKYLKLFENKKVNWESKIIKMISTSITSYFTNIFLDDVDVNEVDELNYTPLNLLAYHTFSTFSTNIHYYLCLPFDVKFKMFKLLIDKDADWNITDFDGNDFIHYLDDDMKKKIIESYPDKYQEYIMRQEVKKYNL